MIFVDGVDVGDIEDVALRDRDAVGRRIFIVVATISEQDGHRCAARDHLPRRCRSPTTSTASSTTSARPWTNPLEPLRREEIPRSTSCRTTSTTTSHARLRAPQAAADGAAGVVESS